VKNKMAILSLTMYENNRLIVYRKDEKGDPILNPKDVLIIQSGEINCERGAIRIKFDANNNYGIVRYSLLNRKGNENLKKIVDEKINKILEEI